MAVFLSDTFTDSDGTWLQNHTPETGGAWAKRAGGSIGTIQSNKAESNASWYTNDATPGGAEYTITADLHSPTDNNEYFYILGRFQDTSNFYMAEYISSTSTMKLHKKVSGVTTQLDALAEAWGTSSAEAKLELFTATKKFYKDSVEKLTTADDSLTDAGEAGFINGDDFTVDNFAADDAGGAPPSENAFMQPMKVAWQK
jgi:hypothetical protein